MNKRIAIFVDDSNYNNIDISHPENGNPGIGGTEYCFANLIYALKKYSNNYIGLYHTGNCRFPDCDCEYIVENIY